MSQLKVNALVSYSGNTVTLGTSGDTINVASNVTFNTASGTLTLPTTIKVDTIQNTNSSTLITQTNSTTITVGVSGQTVALPSQSISYAAISNAVNFRNRIINGDMQIDQRNNGGTVTASGTFPVDRFKQEFTGDGVLTSKRSTDAPAGFKNSIELKVTTIDASIGSTDFYQILQYIEGFNIADIGLGQSWCKPMSLSFYVKASQTGTYSVHLANSNGSRCYPTTITVNSANTWEYKTISIPATTSGTFTTDNSVGLTIRIGFAYGSNFDGATPNTWGTFTSFGDSFVAPTTNMMATLDATFYFTGVQLEAGEQASGFEFLPIDVNLGRCLRYYWEDSLYGIDATGTNGTSLASQKLHPVIMRATPTITQNGSVITSANTAATTFSIDTGTSSSLKTNFFIAVTPSTTRTYLYRPIQASAE